MFKIFAPAKINLHLHITGKRDDGYHYLDSLVTFTDIGDSLTFRASDSFYLEIKGDFSLLFKDALSGPSSVEKAAKLLAEHIGKEANVHITLEKNIPLGAGLGGGSADAAATLKGLNQFWAAGVSANDLKSIGLKIGADVPVCLENKSAIMRGVGDLISTAPTLPLLHAILVWPDCLTPTQDVYKNTTVTDYVEDFSFADNYNDTDELICDLEQTRNDLQSASVKLFPQIGEALSILKQQNGCRFARMSGSGSCVFGLFETAAKAKLAAQQLFVAYPNWWVRTTEVP